MIKTSDLDLALFKLRLPSDKKGTKIYSQVREKQQSVTLVELEADKKRWPFIFNNSLNH